MPHEHVYVAKGCLCHSSSRRVWRPDDGGSHERLATSTISRSTIFAFWLTEVTHFRVRLLGRLPPAATLDHPAGLIKGQRVAREWG